MSEPVFEEGADYTRYAPKPRSGGGRMVADGETGRIRMPRPSASSGGSRGASKGFIKSAKSASAAGGGRRTAIKASFTKTGGQGTAKAKGSAYYYLTRPNESGEKQEREAFGRFAEHIKRDEVYQHLDKAAERDSYHYRFVIAPETDKDAENVDMRRYAREMMSKLEARLGERVPWVGVEHVGENAHTERAHVHLIATTSKRLDREDLQALRQEAKLSFNSALENRDEIQAVGKEQEKDTGLAYAHRCNGGLEL